MKENERREAEIKSIMKAVAPKKEEKKPAAKKQGKKADEEKK